MYCMAQREIDAAKQKGLKNGDLPEMPALFRDAGWATLNHTTLSTSNCGNPALRLFGFGAVVPDGFGIGYIVRRAACALLTGQIKDDAISICAASKHLQTGRYLDTLRAYFLDAKQMITQLYREANVRTEHTFVDHHGGIVDARTGRPISTKVSNDRAASPTDDDDDGAGGNFSFFGEQETFSKVLGASRQKRRTAGHALYINDY